MYSHDSINRFLEREQFETKDLLNEEKYSIELVGGILSVDDSIFDKPYMNPNKAALIGHYWSGKHKRIVKDTNPIPLFYMNINGVSVPVNDRLDDKNHQGEQVATSPAPGAGAPDLRSLSIPACS